MRTGQGQRPSIPALLLSKLAASKTLEDLQKFAREVRGYELHLTEVHPSADLDHFFHLWRGDYSLERGALPGDYVLRFKSPTVCREVMNKVGAGYQGVFKVGPPCNPFPSLILHCVGWHPCTPSLT